MGKTTPRSRQQRRHAEAAVPPRLGYSLSEAAQMAGVGVTLLRKLAASGDLEVRKLGRRIVVTEDALRRLLGERR